MSIEATRCFLVALGPKRFESAQIPTNVCKLSVFKDDKVQLLTQLLELLGKVKSEIFNDIAVGLINQRPF
jgi:hypothetical protein